MKCKGQYDTIIWLDERQMIHEFFARLAFIIIVEQQLKAVRWNYEFWKHEFW